MAKTTNNEAGTAKKYYPKDSLFEGLFYHGIKDKNSQRPKVVKVPCTAKKVVFKGSTVVLEKGKAVSGADLSLMTKYQKELYLELK